MGNEKMIKIFTFIPLLHLGMIYYLAYSCYKYHMKISRFLRTLLLVFGILFLINVPRVIVYQYINTYGIVYYLVTFLFTYLSILFINLILLHERNILINDN